MNLSSLISSFATATGYAITRKARGTITKGRVATGTVSTVTAVASVSPATKDDIERLAQGRQFDEAKILFTTTQMFPGGVGASYEADLISIGGKNYEVAECSTWVDSVSQGSAYRVVVLVVTQ